MLKEKILEDERLELSKIANFLNGQKELLKKQEDNLLKLKKTNAFNDASFNPVLISNYSSYILKSENDILILKNKIRITECDFIKQKQKVKKAYIELKTLEKLKEKQLQRYQKELLDEEIKITDDIVQSRRRA